MVGVIFLIAADMLAFNQVSREATAGAIQINCPWLSSGDATMLSYSVLFLVYVLAMEPWLWFYRIQVYLRVSTLKYLNGLYHLTP